MAYLEIFVAVLIFLSLSNKKSGEKTTPKKTLILMNNFSEIILVNKVNRLIGSPVISSKLDKAAYSLVSKCDLCKSY